MGQLCTDLQIEYLVYCVSLYDVLVTYPRGTENVNIFLFTILLYFLINLTNHPYSDFVYNIFTPVGYSLSTKRKENRA